MGGLLQKKLTSKQGLIREVVKRDRGLNSEVKLSAKTINLFTHYPQLLDNRCSFWTEKLSKMKGKLF